MKIEEQLLERLGEYFVHFQIHERFGITFEKYCNRYLVAPHTCSVQTLKEDVRLNKITKKAATIALVTA